MDLLNQAIKAFITSPIHFPFFFLNDYIRTLGFKSFAEAQTLIKEHFGMIFIPTCIYPQEVYHQQWLLNFNTCVNITVSPNFLIIIFFFNKTAFYLLNSSTNCWTPNLNKYTWRDLFWQFKPLDEMVKMVTQP